MGLRFPALLCTGVFLVSCGGDGPTDPLPDAQGESLVIAPSALLFGAAGERQQLRAYSIDEDGDSTEVAATFATSSAGVASVTPEGIATGGAAIGSAQIVARSGDLVSAPILALRATPAAGALLVADSQVVGSIDPVDPTAPYQPGWRYRVRLRGATLDVGQIVLASGGAPVGGRVVSLAQVGAEVVVVLELIAIGHMFDALQVSQRLSLEHAELAVPAEVRAAFSTWRLKNGGLKAEPRGRAVRFVASGSRSAAATNGIEQEFDLGPFTCKAEVPTPITFPLSLDVFSFEVHPTLSLDLEIEDAALRRFVVEGGIAPTITANPLITAAIEAKAECKVQLATLILPVGGPLSLILGGQVPLGVGFEISAKASFGQLGFDAFLDTSVDAAFGIDCAVGCQVVSALDVQGPSGYFKPKLPSLTGDLRFELGAGAFGWGELTIGNVLLEALRFKAAELKAGLEQKMELATREAQASDPAYASNYALKPVLEAKAAANLQPIANLLSVNLATLSFAPELPTISRSPRGTFTITPASVAPGNGTQLGQQATFTITLTDVTYLGAYAVEGVEIRWRKTNGTTVTLEPGRPGCTDLAATQDQLSFTCQTDFLQAHQGVQTFYAFVRTRIFGVPVPVPLELSIDAKASVEVAAGAIAVALTPPSATLEPGATAQFTATVSGTTTTTVTWTATGGQLTGSGNTVTFTAGSVPGNYAVTATSVADPTRSASAAISIAAASPPGTALLGASGNLVVATAERNNPVSCGINYQPEPPIPQSPGPRECVLTGEVAKARGEWTFSTAASATSLTIDATVPASASHVGATSGEAKLARSTGALTVTFEVRNAPMRYTLTGALSVTGHQGNDWMVWSRVMLLSQQVGSSAPIEDGVTGWLPGVSTGTTAVTLDRTGVLQPGIYLLSINSQLGQDGFTGGNSYQAQARSGTANAQARLVLSPP